MAEVARGLYRIIYKDGLPNVIYMTDGKYTYNITEDGYRAAHFSPPFEDLPLKEEYKPESGDLK